MLKKLFSASAFSLFLIAPGFADDFSIAVEVPAAPKTAEEIAVREATLLAAAEEVCDRVEYVGLEAFYSVRAKRACVKDTLAAAQVKAEELSVMAYAETAETTLD